MSAQRQQGGGLSMPTLLIASAASMAAAIVVHEVWKGGAILGAAITPVVVAIVSEALRKPVDRVSARRERARGSGPPPGDFPVVPPAAAAGRDDPFGIWADPKDPWYRRVRGRHLRIALVTGVLAFAAGAVALTASELIFGGSVGSGGDRVTIVPGGREDDRERERDRDENAPTTPTTTEAVPPAEAPAPQTTPTTPTPTAPPTTPAPAEPAPAPTPAPGQEPPAPDGGAAPPG